MPKRKSKRADLALRSTQDQVYRSVLKTVLQSCDIEEAPRLLELLRSSSFGKLLDWSERPSPQMYDSARSYFLEAQIAALIRKYPFTALQVPGLDPEKAALSKFHKAEHRCGRYNRRAILKRKRWNDHAQIYEYARQYIERVIGREPDLPSILDQCDFTAGASLGVHGNRTNPMRKLFASSWTVTPSALPYAIVALWKHIQVRDCILPGAIKCYDPIAFKDLVCSRVEYVDCNKISFVPKTAKTHRSIAVEPLLNGFVQKGIDTFMRAKLARVGIDLSDQGNNQALARKGTLQSFNPYCTIDLAAASDSLSIEVVRDLLPPAWFEFLDEVRSPRYKLNSSASTRYNKFCSMGNGFCFPLQTLIFSSVCYAVGRHVNGGRDYDFSVYGDDIIVRQNVALLVVEILKDIGFSINADKTFITGPFRESCGSDWFNGQDVRPVHCAKPLSNSREVMAFHNSTWRSTRCATFFEEVRPLLRSITSQPLMRPGCEPGDTCFSVPLDVAMGSKFVTWNRSVQAFQWLEYISKPVVDPIRLGVDEHASALMYAAMRGSSSAQPYTVRYEYTTKVVSRTGPYRTLHEIPPDAEQFRVSSSYRKDLRPVYRAQVSACLSK